MAQRSNNKIFGSSEHSPTPAAQQVKTLNLIERVKEQFGLDIPTHSVPLPSGGVVYPVGCALHGVTAVDIRAMTTREEDILTSQALIKKGTVINELIRSCLVEKSFATEDLLLGDRNSLMVAVRAAGYGAEYEAEVKCQAEGCGFVNRHVFNLAALEIKSLEIEPIVVGQNLFEYELPQSKLKVRFKFLTGKDELESGELKDREQKAGITKDDNVSTTLMRVIKAVQDKGGTWIENSGETRAVIDVLIHQMLPAEDATSLRLYIKNNEPGIVMKQEFTCQKCGEVDEVAIPIGATFLWPASK